MFPVSAAMLKSPADYDASLEAFSVQAATGFDDADRQQLATQHLDRDDYDQLVHPRFRVSDSYLVPPPTVTWPPRVPRFSTRMRSDRRSRDPRTGLPARW